MDRFPPSDWLAIDLTDRQAIDWRFLAVVLAVEVLLSSVINLVVFPSVWAESLVFAPVRTATGGLVSPSLLVNLVNLTIVVGGLLMIVGGCRWRDLGIDRSNLPVAIAITAVLWGVVQFLGAVLSFRATGTVGRDLLWTDIGVGVTLGMLIAQVLGNALYEEILFRAVLFDQLILQLRDHQSGYEYALIGSQLVFALMHVPNRLYRGYSIPELSESLATLFLLGLLFAIVYHRTGNLFVAVGVHALVNTPTMVVDAPVSGQFLVLMLITVMVVLWPLRRRWSRQGEFDSAED